MSPGPDSCHNKCKAHNIARPVEAVGQGVDVVAFSDEEGHFGNFFGSYSFLGELRRRHVFRVAVAYAALAWLTVQVADIYERDVQTTLKRLLTLAEPVIIVSIALLITVIILSVVLMILESNNLAF